MWQRLFDTYRRTVMAAAMLGVHGRVQKEGQVIHVIADRLEDLSPLLGSVGQRDFPHRTGPGDGARGASPDSRHGPKARDLYPPPFRHGPRAVPEGAVPQIKVKSRDFH